jgi:hypothetical protein
MLHRVALVKTDISEELKASFIKATRIGKPSVLVFLRSVRRLLVTASVVPSSPILVTSTKEALSSSETPVFTEATSQKTLFFIVTAVKTSNLTGYVLFVLYNL